MELIYNLNLFSNIYLIAISIIVQLVVYPSFKNLKKESFTTFHKNYTKKMLFVVGPIMLLELVASLILVLKFDQTKLPLIPLSFVWFLTFLLIVPVHNKLSGRFQEIEHKKLINLNFFRTIAWIVKFVFTLIYRV